MVCLARNQAVNDFELNEVLLRLEDQNEIRIV